MKPTRGGWHLITRHPNFGAVHFGWLLAFCDSQNKAWEAGPAYDKIWKFLRMSVLQYRSRRGVHIRRAPLNWRYIRGNSALALEDKFDDIKKLIDAGKEKGYLTYNEVNDLIPHDVHSPEESLK